MGISVWQLLIVFLIVLLLFGTTRLRTIGSDLGAALRGFRSAVKDGEEGEDKKEGGNTIEGNATREEAKDKVKG